MDSILGIGLPELFFIAVLALIILGPERLPGTLREIAKAWGYVRNLGKELTAQFGDEFKALEDLDPRKILNEMADEEMAKDLGLKRPATAQKKTTPATPAKTTPAKTTPATPAKTTPAKTTPAKPTPAQTTTVPPAVSATDTDSTLAAATQPVDESTPASQPETPLADATSSAATVDAEAENQILPPAPALETPRETPKEAPKLSSVKGEEAPLAKQPIVSAMPVNTNGAIEPTESAE